jgi:hypothetical protein
VCEAQRAGVQRDVDFMPHWGGRGECVQRQLWHVIIVIAIVLSSISKFGLFVLRAGDRWRVFAFLGGCACGGSGGGM